MNNCPIVGLWDLKSIQILGRLEHVDQGWVFHPERFAAGGSFLGLQGQMRWVFDARAAANRLLQKRGIPRLKVRWEAFNVVKAEAKKAK